MSLECASAWIDMCRAMYIVPCRGNKFHDLLEFCPVRLVQLWIANLSECNHEQA